MFITFGICVAEKRGHISHARDLIVISSNEFIGFRNIRYGIIDLTIRFLNAIGIQTWIQTRLRNLY